MAKNELVESYVVSKKRINIDGVEYREGDFVSSLGDISNRMRRNLLEAGRLRRVVVVTPAKLKQLQRESAQA